MELTGALEIIPDRIPVAVEMDAGWNNGLGCVHVKIAQIVSAAPQPDASQGETPANVDL